MIITPTHLIQKRIVEAIRKKAQEKEPKQITRAASELFVKIYEILNESILSSNEVISLINGKLRADFGLDEEKVSFLPTIMIDLIELYYDNIFENLDKNTAFAVQFTVRAREESDPYVQSAILRAQYVSPRSNELIDWLRWLLFSGSDIINESYKVYHKDGRGRSGMAIMVKGDGFAFKVDGEFSGTAKSNFVSRSIESAKDRIAQEIRSFVNGA